MENLPYLVAAYVAILIILGGYVVRMHRREKSLCQQADALRQDAPRA